MGGAGVQGPGFSPELQGTKALETSVPVLAFACDSLPASSFLPRRLSSHFPWGAPLIAPRVPKDSVLTTGLISRFLISLYLSTSHTLKAETLILDSSLLLPRPLPKLRPKSMFFKRYD